MDREKFFEMQKCRRCAAGELKIISDFNGSLVVVHCQNKNCDVTYETKMVPSQFRPGSMRRRDRKSVRGSRSSQR
jgi:hypothetical protein